MTIPSMDTTREIQPHTLEERILAIVLGRGRAGITRDELLRKLGVAYDELMDALEALSAQGQVRVHWPTPESFRVFYSA